MCRICCVNPFSISLFCILKELSRNYMLTTGASGAIGTKSDQNMSTNFFQVKSNEGFIEEQRELKFHRFSITKYF